MTDEAALVICGLIALLVLKIWFQANDEDDS
jgi:hypothetical protein